jgi:opacity protein-like surface antigen
MLKTLLATVACILITAPFVSAQQSPEVFVGYSNLQGEGLPARNDPNWPFNTSFFSSRTTLHGVNAAITGYMENFGITGDFSFNRKGRTEDFTGGRDNQHTDVFYFLGGPTVKFNKTGRAQPFTRVMAGAAYTRFKASREFDTSTGTNTNSFVVGSTDFTASVGGGLDIRAGERAKIRVIQLDWAPVFLKDRTVNVLGSAGIIEPATLNGQRQDNWRFSFGVAF